ncbi:hypothetical protein E5676_scaffold21G003360 [Cucumis melo var. makuwa]|uniref:DUF4218 domain-containing protein n=1 Tax=Cucumis melo var. makuwa TaxID=1194695 RepID=A0A5D3CXB4_CUCMM|nr:hypothetical protein E5676_scaffold21G003360 [Cucumis melo var. makuwa]
MCSTTIPSSFYEAKRKLRNLDLGYETIHACKYGCVLYWKEFADLQHCPTCGEARKGVLTWDDIWIDKFLHITTHTRVHMYDSLTGWSTKGYQACPLCMGDKSYFRSRGRISFMGHRRYLPENHVWHRSRLHDGKVERRAPPMVMNGHEILKQLDQLEFPVMSKHPSNVCDNLVGTLLNIEGKTKDTMNASWMYLIKRSLCTLKQYVRNKARPEGSIAEAFVMNESSTFSSCYLSGIETRFTRDEQNDDTIIEDGVLELREFGNLSDDFFPVTMRPSFDVRCYNRCIVAGLRFHTSNLDSRRTTQNSGVMVIGESDASGSGDNNFYGVLDEVLHVEYPLERNV